MKKKTLERDPRGYLLMEAMVAGALLAVMLATTFTIIGDARRETIYASREAEAISLCRMQLENLGAIETLAAATQPLIDVDPINYPGLKWTWTVADVTATYAGFSPLGITKSTLWDVTVTVQYPTATPTPSCPGAVCSFTLETLKERS